jgi:hypothetical protein
MNIVAEVKDYIIEFAERKGHQPKHIILGRDEKARLRNLPNLMLVEAPEEWPDKLFTLQIFYSSDNSCLKVG